MIDKRLGLIGLAMKAGKISFGTDVVEENINKGKISLVIIADDSSERTKTKFIKICEKYNLPIIIDWSIDILSNTIGKENKAVIGIKDANFSKEILKKYSGGDVIG